MQTSTTTTTTTPTGFRTLVARFPGSCRRCNGPIAVGDTIRYGGKGRVYHFAVHCAGQAPIVDVDDTQAPASVDDTPAPSFADGARYLCWLRACDQPATVGRRHKRFGLVAACQDHDPAAHGYDAPLVLPGTVAAPAAGGDTPAQAGGGQRSKVSPAPVPMPPAGGAALPAPQVPQAARQATRRPRVAVTPVATLDAF